MNKKLLIFFFFVLLVSTECFAQEEIHSVKENEQHLSFPFPSNQLYVEILGSAIYLSINYEHIFQNHFGYRLGIGVTIVSINTNGIRGGEPAGVAIAMGEYHYPLSDVLFVKAGLGAVSLLSFNLRNHWAIAPDSSNIQPFALAGSLGVEYIHSDGGFTASLLATPICSLFPMHVFGWFGLTLGSAF